MYNIFSKYKYYSSHTGLASTFPPSGLSSLTPATTTGFSFAASTGTAPQLSFGQQQLAPTPDNAAGMVFSATPQFNFTSVGGAGGGGGGGGGGGIFGQVMGGQQPFQFAATQPSVAAGSTGLLGPQSSTPIPNFQFGGTGDSSGPGFTAGMGGGPRRVIKKATRRKK